MQITKHKLLISLMIGLISGCASDYPCGEPGMGKCMSVTENYDSSFNDFTNPDDKAPKGFFGGVNDDNSGGNQFSNNEFSGNNDINGNDNKNLLSLNFNKYTQIPADGAPLVSKPTMIKVWITPYTDTDNIYHDQQYEYILTDRGHWLFNNNNPLHTNDTPTISLAQGTQNSTPTTSLGNYGNPPKLSQNSTNPGSFLNDYPALNALKNQSVPVISTTNGVNKTTLIPTT